MAKVVIRRKVKPLCSAKGLYISVQYKNPGTNEWTHSCYVSEARAENLRGRGYRFVDTRRGVIYE